MKQKAYILLSNGQLFEGWSFGATRSVIGEMVFTTGMTGYLETLTDPSYFGQIVMQTFPLIGNYGIIPSDFESDKSHIKAYVVREYCKEPSNFRNAGLIEDFLIKNDIPGVYGIDTRRLTKIIRESGVMNARVITGDEAIKLSNLEKDKVKQFLEKLLPEIKSYTIQNAVENVSLCADKVSKPVEQILSDTSAYNKLSKKITESGKKTDGSSYKVVLWDFGAKANIRRELLKRGLDVETISYNSTAEEIISKHPDGVMLSNGPGDPAENISIIKEIVKVAEKKIPIFGICLGHQLLALAKGAKTEKLHYGHRGANQPVKKLSTGRVYITSQNHGYAVIPESLPKTATLSFINTNDNTCEGISYTDIPAFSVQFHPEASSGPLDTNFLFDEFVTVIKTASSKAL